MTAATIITRYGLQSHPEGGWYREVYRSAMPVGQPPGYAGERSALTAIYFLLEQDDFSAFHRVRGEEAWIHLAGAPLELVLLDNGPARLLLTSPGGGGAPLLVVPPGVLQAARSLGDFTLVSCLVAPGFEFADFSLPGRQELLLSYAGYESLIREFTRS
jgi:predicted cupin superfamily sugar epimerase